MLLRAQFTSDGQDNDQPTRQVSDGLKAHGGPDSFKTRMKASLGQLSWALRFA